MKLNARDEVVAQGSTITVNGAAVKVSVFHGYALRGLDVHGHRVWSDSVVLVRFTAIKASVD